MCAMKSLFVLKNVSNVKCNLTLELVLIWYIGTIFCEQKTLLSSTEVFWLSRRSLVAVLWYYLSLIRVLCTGHTTESRYL